jgi:transposase
MAALAQANRVRSARAKLKADLRRGAVTLSDVLSDPPDYVETAKVITLLRAVPKLGPIKAATIMDVCRVSPSRTVAGLSERQRAALLASLPGR